MGFLENSKVALEGLRLNKMRTFLTMLGIIIGISSVIAIITIGDSMANTVNQGLDSFGSLSIMVNVTPRESFSWEDYSTKDALKKDDIEQMKTRFQDRIDSIVFEGPSVPASLSQGRKKAKIRVSSVSPGMSKVLNINMITGRFLADFDVNEEREVAVISDSVVEKLFNGETKKVLGTMLTVDTGSQSNTYTIVGIYKYEPINFGVLGGQGDDDPTDFYIPYSVGSRQYGSANRDEGFFSFLVVAKERDDISSLSSDMETFFNDRQYANNDKFKVRSQTFESQLNQVTQIMSTIQLAIGGIAAISLLVGGIGVMNILLVSVTERTREIGIRKALGATYRDIRGQFITESVIICIIGGIFGILLGSLVGYLVSLVLKAPTLPSIPAILIAVGFSMAIGIFFGYYPASKAAKLNPIDALRYE